MSNKRVWIVPTVDEAEALQALLFSLQDEDTTDVVFPGDVDIVEVDADTLNVLLVDWVDELDESLGTDDDDDDLVCGDCNEYLEDCECLDNQ